MSLPSTESEYASIVESTGGFLLDVHLEGYLTDLVEAVRPLLTVPLEEFWIVQDRRAWDLTLETEETKTFEPVGFRFALPPVGTNGIQELNIAIDNTDRRITDFIKNVKDTGVAVQVEYRPFLSSDTSHPQMTQPLRLFMRNITVTPTEVTATCSFADIVNKKAPAQLYTRTRFPSIGEL